MERSFKTISNKWKVYKYPEIANAQFQMACPLAIQLARKVV